MNVDTRDALDRTIDDVLVTVMAGEPRRVSAASVRAAMEEKRPSSLPMWLAAAAVLLMGLALALTNRTPVESRLERVGSAGEGRDPRSAAPAPRTEPIQDAPIPIRAAAKSPRADRGEDVQWEGLPRLAIAAIDLPEPLFTGLLEADPIHIPRIEIPPLSVSALANEQKQN